MKKLYLILAIIGFLAPNILVAMVSLETGNVLLWLDLQATIVGMFDNEKHTFQRVSYQESKKALSLGKKIDCRAGALSTYDSKFMP